MFACLYWRNSERLCDFKAKLFPFKFFGASMGYQVCLDPKKHKISHQVDSNIYFSLIHQLVWCPRYVIDWGKGGYQMSTLLNKPRYVINLSTKGEAGSLKSLSAYSI